MEPLLTVMETARILNLRYYRVCELIRRGYLPAVRVGRQLRIAPAKLREFIENGGQPLPGGWRRQPRDGQSAGAAA